MRIAFVAETLGYPMYLGGITRYTMLLGKALTELGHEVHVYTMATPEQARAELSADCPFVLHHVSYYAPKLFGFRTLYYRLLHARFPGYAFVNEWAVPCILQVIKDARSGLIDIIEAPETGGRVAVGAKLIERHVPVVGRLHAPSFITAHDFYGQKSAHLRQLGHMEKLFVRHATALSAPSQSVADLVHQAFGRGGSPISVIPHPVMVPDLATIDVRTASEPRVVFVGRFEVLKGFDTLLRALPKVVAKVPSVIFDLVGPDSIGAFKDGIERGLCTYMSPEQAAQVAPAIRLHGQVTSEQGDLIRAAASCVVVPSTYESFSFTLTEAMALGRPVIASRVGGMAEIIEPGKNGLLIEVGASDALSDAIIDLLTHKEKAHALGEQAKRDVQSRYAPAVVARAMGDFYSDVLRTWKSAK